MPASTITVVGNVVDDVVCRRTSGGITQLSFRVASTERRKKEETNEWYDGDQLFVRVTCWRQFAENVAASLKKGDPVIVHGKMFSRQYVKDEVSRVSYDIKADTIGHDLSRGSAEFQRRRRAISAEVEVDDSGHPALVDADLVDYEYVMQSADGASAGEFGASRPGPGDDRHARDRVLAAAG